MIVQEEFVSINTTPDVVERYLTDPALLDQWRSPLVALDPLEGNLMERGSMHKLRIKTLALAGATYTVTERDSSHILLAMDGLWKGTDLWRWYADGARTIVQNRVEYEVPDPSLRVFIAGLGQIFASFDMRLQMSRLRDLIEGPSRGAPKAQKINVEQQSPRTLMTTHQIEERWLDGLHGPMRYWQSEPRHGLPVLLIHGYGAMIEHWRAVMRPIARQHSFTALDLYYFGRSAIPTEQPSQRIWADQAAELIAAASHGPAVVIGHSMGGMVAAQLAHDYPQLVRGLVLVDSTGLNDPRNQPSELDNLMLGFASSPGVGELLVSLVGNSWGARQGLLSAYHQKDRVTPEMIAQFSAPLSRPGGSSAYLAVSRAFPRLFLTFPKGAVRAPTLLIWGENDGSVPPALAEYFQQALLPQAEIAVIPNTGHCPFDETPEAFCDILLPWLDRLAAQAS